MSGKLMGTVYEYEFSHGEQSILLAMADHAQDDGSHCFPSIRRICWKTGYERRHVQRLMAGLRDSGVLTEVRAATTNHPVEYAIHLDAATKKPPFEDSVTGGVISTGGGLEDQGGRDSEQSGAVPTPPEPSIEPSIEPSTTSSDLEDDELQGAEAGNGGEGQSAQQQVEKEEGPVANEDIDTLVEALWDFYVEVFKPKRPKLSPSRARAIRKGFKEEFTLDDLKLAVRGLRLWRKRKPGDESISSLFTTYPGGQTLADRISFFIDVAEKQGIAGSITSADRAIVQQKQLDVQRGHRSTSQEQVQQAQEAEEWLRQHGIETVYGEDGYPTFKVGGSA